MLTDMIQARKCWEISMPTHHFWLADVRFACLQPLLPNKPGGVLPIVGRIFGKLKDWCGIEMRHDRCAHIFMPTIAIAATVIF